MTDEVQQRVALALEGHPQSMRALVAQLTPVISTRVGRILSRRLGQARGRDVRQELEDMTQEVFISLFESKGRALRAWDPNRGLSLDAFVGFLAERQVASILRTGRRSPWTEDPTLDEDLSALGGSNDGLEFQTQSRELLEAILDRLRCELSPRGLHLFYALVVEQRTVDEVASETKMTRDALYAWKSRLIKQVKRHAAELEAADVASPLALGART